MDNDVTKKTSQKLTIAIIRLLKYLTLGVVLFFLLIILVALLEKDSEADRLETIRIGNQVVDFLDKYRLENGRYPESLDKLGEVPEPKWGEKWLYKCLKDGDAYELLTGHENKDGSYGPALYYNNENNSSEWLYFDQDDSIEMK